MPKGLEPGEVAKLNYNELCYAHIATKAGEQQILTADPWAFVQRALNESDLPPISQTPLEGGQ